MPPTLACCERGGGVRVRRVDGTPRRRGGKRGEIAQRPGDDDAASVTLEAGYPYAPDSSASVVVGDLEVSLRTEGSTAWLDQDAARLIAAMRAGREMVVRGGRLPSCAGREAGLAAATEQQGRHQHVQQGAHAGSIARQRPGAFTPPAPAAASSQQPEASSQQPA